MELIADIVPDMVSYLLQKDKSTLLIPPPIRIVFIGVLK